MRKNSRWIRKKLDSFLIQSRTSSNATLSAAIKLPDRTGTTQEQVEVQGKGEDNIRRGLLSLLVHVLSNKIRTLIPTPGEMARDVHLATSLSESLARRPPLSIKVPGVLH